MTPEQRPLRLLWLGTYERDYTRTRVLFAGLRELGHEVVECHMPLWELTRHKAGDFLSPRQLATSGGRACAAWASLLRSQRQVGPVDAVVAGYPAQPDVVPAAIVARARRVPLVADVMISFSDTLGGDRGRAGRAGAAALSLLDKVTLRIPDVVICDTHQHARYFEQRYGADPNTIGIARLGAESEIFKPRPEAPGPVRALFYGKLAPLHGIQTILEAARIPGTPPVRLAGDGQLGDWLAAELERSRPPGFEHVPWLEHERLGAEIAAAGIVLGIFGTSEKVRRVVPNKVYHAMAVGRPIVTADTPAIREVLANEENALLVPAGDPRALADAMSRLTADAELRRRLGESARRRFDEVARQDVVAGEFVRALRRR